MGKKGDLSDFECGMVVGARRAALSISQNRYCARSVCLNVGVDVLAF